MELINSKNAQLLNDLNDKSLAYPYQAIKGILCQAEATILNQEKEIESLRVQLSAMQTSKPVRTDVLVESLRKLAILGNEPYLGNSIGNTIAQEALRTYEDTLLEKEREL